jgi:NAD(P)-dependent dehydrogenase (short-subunit alcohol dehydrogenase family)
VALTKLSPLVSKTLSSELRGRGIRVNAVSPGPVETPLYDKLGIPDAYREQVNKDITATIPFGRSCMLEAPRSCAGHRRLRPWPDLASVSAGRRSGREPVERLRRNRPGQQLLDPVDRVVGDPTEHFAQVRLGIKPVE